MRIYATVQGPARIWEPTKADPTQASVNNAFPFSVTYARDDGGTVPAKLFVPVYVGVRTYPIAGVPDADHFNLYNSEWILVVLVSSKVWRVVPAWAFNLLDDGIGEDYAMTHRVLYTGEVLLAQQF